MSIEATVWALKFAPPMPPQLLGTLFGLAEHADTRGRGAYPSVPTLAAYACKAERSVQRDLQELVRLELIRLGNQALAAHLPSGKRPAVYDLAMEKVVPGGRAGDDGEALAHREKLVASRERGRAARDAKKAAVLSNTGDVHVTPEVTPTSGVTSTSPHNDSNQETPSSDSGWGDAHVRGDVHVTGDAHVADGVTPTSGRGDAHVTQTLLEPPTEPKEEREDARASGDSLHGDPVAFHGTGALAPAKPEHHLDAFGAFWLAYPRKKSREEAKREWINAMDRGADPQHIVDAATAYARERASEDPRYTPYPARWLSEGRYDDEPDPQPGHPQLRAINGSGQPTGQPLTGTDARVAGWLALASGKENQ